jgi:hypothetical protein
VNRWWGPYATAMAVLTVILAAEHTARLLHLRGG